MSHYLRDIIYHFLKKIEKNFKVVKKEDEFQHYQIKIKKVGQSLFLVQTKTIDLKFSLTLGGYNTIIIIWLILIDRFSINKPYPRKPINGSICVKWLYFESSIRAFCCYFYCIIVHSDIWYTIFRETDENENKNENHK